MVHVLEAYDDLNMAMDGSKVLAPNTVKISYEVRTFDPGGETATVEKLEFEMDLGNEHLKIVDMAMNELRMAGRSVSSIRPSLLPGNKPAPTIPVVVLSDFKYKKALRQWVDDHNVQHPDVADLAAYVRFPLTDHPRRRYHYPELLRKRFEKATGITGYGT